MPLFAISSSRFWVSILLISSLVLSVVAIAQVNLPYRLLKGFEVNNEPTLNKGKTSLFILEQSSDFEQMFNATASHGKHPDTPNFTKEMVVSVVMPSTNKPPKLSISKVFVQDSTLTVRYIRMTDTTLTKNPLPPTTRPFLLLAIPKTPLLKAKLVENGKVIQTVKLQEEE